MNPIENLKKHLEEPKKENALPQATQVGDVAQATGGLTARQYAAIKLRAPNSGTDWLDAMIKESLRDEFAAKAMPLAIRQWHEEVQTAHKRRASEETGFVWLDEDSEDGSDCHIVATYAYAMADAMLCARKA